MSTTSPDEYSQTDRKLWATLQECMRGNVEESERAGNQLREFSQTSHLPSRSALAYFLQYGLRPFEHTSPQEATQQAIDLLHTSPRLIDKISLALIYDSMQQPELAISILPDHCIVKSYLLFSRTDKTDRDIKQALQIINEHTHDNGYLHGLIYEIGVPPFVPADLEKAKLIYSKYPTNSFCLTRLTVLNNYDKTLLDRAYQHNLSSCNADEFVNFNHISLISTKLFQLHPRHNIASDSFYLKEVQNTDVIWNFCLYNVIHNEKPYSEMIELLQHRSITTKPKINLLACLLHAKDGQARESRQCLTDVINDIDLSTPPHLIDTAKTLMFSKDLDQSDVVVRAAELAMATAAYQFEVKAIDILMKYRSSLLNTKVMNCFLVIAFSCLDHHHAPAIDYMLQISNENDQVRSRYMYSGFHDLLICFKSTVEDSDKRAALQGAKILLGVHEPLESNSDQRNSQVKIPKMPNVACLLLIRAASISDDEKETRESEGNREERRVISEASYMLGILCQQTRQYLSHHYHKRAYEVSKTESKWYTPRAACNAGLIRLTGAKGLSQVGIEGGELLHAAASSDSFRSLTEKAHALNQYGAFLEAALEDKQAAVQQYINILTNVDQVSVASEVNLARLIAMSARPHPEDGRNTKSFARRGKVFIVQPVRFFVAIFRSFKGLTDGNPVGLSLFQGDLDSEGELERNGVKDVEKWVKRMEFVWRIINESPVRLVISLLTWIVLSVVRHQLLAKYEADMGLFITFGIMWTCFSIAFSIQIN